MAEFEFAIVYKLGRVTQVPDAFSRFKRPQEDNHDRLIDDEIHILSFHVALPTTRRRCRQRFVTDTIWEEDMVDPEDLDPFISLEHKYADCIRTAPCEQE